MATAVASWTKARASQHRRFSVGDLPLNQLGISGVSESKSSWWHNITTAINPKVRSRRKGSVPQLTVGGRNELQWYGSNLTNSSKHAAAAATVTSMSFNESGNMLCYGDRFGQIVVVKQTTASDKKGHKSRGKYDYSVYSSFQSHEAEFDFQNTASVDASIVQTKWLPRCGPAHFILSTNERTIKLWKISEHCRSYSESDVPVSNPNSTDGSVPVLRLPKIVRTEKSSVFSRPQRVYSNLHNYRINSISLNADQQTFISADDVSIHLWHLEVTDRVFNVVDLAPDLVPTETGADRIELAETITVAEFHPVESHVFAYGTNAGNIRLCDMRQQALCDSNVKVYPNRPSGGESGSSLLSRLTHGITDVKFGRTEGGRYLLSRDYMTMKVWDVRVDGREPCETYDIHPYLNSKLGKLYEGDCLGDKFECGWGPNDRIVSAGSYNDLLNLYDRNLNTTGTFHVVPDEHRSPLKRCMVVTSGDGVKGRKDVISAERLLLGRRLIHTAWHPTDCVMAASSGARMYLISGEDI